MLVDICYTLNEKQTGLLVPNPFSAYHEFTCEIDSKILPLQQGIQIGIEVAKRVDLTSFRVRRVHCLPHTSRRTYQVIRSNKTTSTPAYMNLTFDEAIEIVREQLTRNGQRWASAYQYEIAPEDA